MDLRIIRTRNSIMSAFLEIKAKKPIEKITIKELTEKAGISKQTFYLHYRDIYDLAETLENEAINSLVKDIPNPDFIVSNAKEAARQLYNAFLSQGNMFNILFSLGQYGSDSKDSQSRQYGVLIDKIEAKVKEMIFESHPEFKDDLKENVILSLIITGSASTFFKYQSENPEEVITILSDLIDCIVTYHH